MLNKKYLFIFISVLLAFIISSFYNKVMDLNFLMVFIVLSLFLYVVFYYLGSTKENYDNYSRFYNQQYHSYDNLNNHILRDHLEDSEYNEEEMPLIKAMKNIHHQTMEEEEIHKAHPAMQVQQTQQTQQTQPSQQVQPTQQAQMEEEEPKSKELQKPDINKIILENPITRTPSPLNINISYNSQNSINELDNNEKNNKDYIDHKNSKMKSKNLGSYCDNTRVYNNSDWIYGSSAWTNDPDYYIPNKGCTSNCQKDTNCIKEVPQPLNELINANKYKENKNVCPLMVNTPWTEYKSGDSEPEPYNL